MDYKQAIEWYDALSASGIKPGLERVKELLSLLGNPHEKLKYVHVAGTNGKGSFCAMISGILSCAGYKTGLFTSPYVIAFEEQIQINGAYITKGEVSRIFSFIREKCKSMTEQPTAFEALTAAAFLYFYEQNCDVVVLECGMGGKNDCTNVIPAPDLSVLMSVSLDHTAFLGDTIKKIAEEKCGIIKEGCYAVCYPLNGSFPQENDTAEVFSNVCRDKGVTYEIADINDISVLKENLFSTDVETIYGKINVPFAGRHQTANFATVIKAVELLRRRGYIISDSDIKIGVEGAYMPARLEKLSDIPLVIVDGGHNPGCAAAVQTYLHEMQGNRKTIILGALMKDKDFDGTFGPLLKQCHEAVFTRAALERSENPDILCRKAKKYTAKVSAFDDSETAMSYATSLVGENDLLLVCGSFYLAREIKNKFSPAGFRQNI